MEPLLEDEYNQFRNLLVSACGIVLKDDQDYLVETRLTELAYEVGVANFGELYHKVAANEELLSRVVDLMTTNETLWFRDESCWKTLEHLVIPELIKMLQAGKMKVRVWSAASSTGQEAYSLTILLTEILSRNSQTPLLDRFEIIGTDISKSAVFLARNGRYDPFTISRGMSKDRLERFFNKDKNSYVLSEEIKKRVEFRNFNLMEDFSPLGTFELVLCRNVAIYFSEEFKQGLFNKIAKIMNPEGFLLLGATESLFGIKTEFSNRNFENGIYYQPKPN